MNILWQDLRYGTDALLRRVVKVDLLIALRGE